jgi:quinohemoprotein ethanol dehydrogenase
MFENANRLGFGVAAAVAAIIALPLIGAQFSGVKEPSSISTDPAKSQASAKENSTRLARAADIDGARVMAADQEPGNWPAHGRTYGEQRFSPLAKINADNASTLGAAWEYETNTIRGLEASPIVVDGVMFATGSWSVVYALDAKTGEELWTYDPKVPGEWGRKGCCDVVNRGVAVWKGRVYVGTYDGRLVSLEAKSGKPIWDISTIDRTKPYTITGAPRIVKGKVIIGNGGGELGVRGYITAYDAETGHQDWRFYIVPGDPRAPVESEHLKKALPTWNSEGGNWKWWEIGGGGTAWDSMAYDPELDLLYVGTGNGSPWSRYIRSPGGGDNLYVSSILAIRPDSGELAWHYQTTPGDSWDYTATQHLILAELEIKGRPRKVIMQAPKNGFFYVLDRQSGEVISADAYVPMNWATGFDLKTGRPTENKAINYRDKVQIVYPSPVGGHNWQPMSFNPVTRLVYIPVQEQAQAFLGDAKLDIRLGAWNTGIDFPAISKVLEQELAAGRIPPANGFLVAWDPVQKKQAWRVAHPTFWNGGTLTTAGNLVFQGLADGTLNAWRADTGEVAWSYNTGTGIIAPPVTYEVDGQQYIAVAAGWGGVALSQGPEAQSAIVKNGVNEGKIVAFKLGGKSAGEIAKIDRGPMSKPPGETASAQTVEKGFAAYHRHCAICHGFLTLTSNVVPDLKWSAPDTFNDYEGIVLEGKLKDRGMASFADHLQVEDVQAIQAYVVKEANAAYRRANNIPEPQTAAKPVQRSAPKAKPVRRRWHR